MANASQTGFRPVRTRSGGFVSYKRKQALNAPTLAVFMFDLVVPLTTGLWYVATTTTTGVGSVACGATYTNARNEQVPDVYLPALTTGSATLDAVAANYISIAEDPLNLVLESQIDEAIVFSGLDIFYNFVAGAGSTATGISGHEIDATSPASTATIPIHVTDFVDRSDNDKAGADVKVECRLNDGIYLLVAARASLAP